MPISLFTWNKDDKNERKDLSGIEPKTFPDHEALRHCCKGNVITTRLQIL